MRLLKSLDSRVCTNVFESAVVVATACARACEATPSGDHA